MGFKSYMFSLCSIIKRKLVNYLKKKMETIKQTNAAFILTSIDKPYNKIKKKNRYFFFRVSDK